VTSILPRPTCSMLAVASPAAISSSIILAFTPRAEAC
jgi:hypothetical protein